MDFSVSIKLQKAAKKAAESGNYKELNAQGGSSTTQKKDGTLQEYYRNAGQANFELGQYNEAFQHFDNALKEDKDSNGSNFLNRGMVFMKLGLYDDAQHDFNMSLRMYSGNTVKDSETVKKENQYKVHYNMGINFRNMGEFQNSVD